MTKLNEEAINGITLLLNEVKDVIRLLNEFGIHIDSDCWSATIPVDHTYENILDWNKKDFETLDVSNINAFTIGGNISTGYEHEYKNETIIAPKKLAEIQGEIFEKYLKSILQSVSLKHFKLEIEEPYGLIDNCGWEHYLCIKATIKESGLKQEDDKMNIECILQALKDKGHIKYYQYGYDTMPMFYRIESKRGEKLGNKILELFSKQNNRGNYIVKSVTSTNTKIEFVKIDDLLKWLKQDKFQKNECTVIDWNNSHLDFEFEKFLTTDTKFEMKRQKFGEGMEIINTKIRSEKHKLEKLKEQEALDLIDLLS